MSKKEIEKTWKATSKLNTEINNDNDISNLNDDNSFLPIEEEERAPLTEEEKKSIRKKLFFLLIIVVIVLIALLVTLIFNPFQSNKKTTDEETKPTIEEEVNEKVGKGIETKIFRRSFMFVGLWRILIIMV